MEIRILGAHNIESSTTGFFTLLIDNVLAIDASTLTSKLSFAEQQKLKAVLLTHQHYDHVRNIPSLGMNFSLHGNSLSIYCTQAVYDTIATHLLNDILYPNFIERPKNNPALHFNIVEPGKSLNVNGYEVLPLSANHIVPTVGYQIAAPDGKKVFVTSDTGPGLTEVWQKIRPQILIIELTAPNKDHEFVTKVGHLTPTLLQKEMESFRSIKGYLPKIVLTHMSPLEEKEIKAEIREVEKALDTKIHFGYEGMKITL
jgi:ribonuclease BN (tRNA processing enzyme)